MSVRFGIDLEELDGCIARMTSFQTRIEQQLAHLDTAIDDLHVTWTGDAAASQRAAHAEWTAGAEQMHQALGEMIAAAKLAHANYQSAATTNQSMWRGLT